MNIKLKALGCVLLTNLLLALSIQPAMAAQSIVGSKHDFTATATPAVAWTGNRICAACHTPHGGDTTNIGVMWSHTNTAATTFTPYLNANGSLETGNALPNASPMSAGTKLCLSCHDGTIALDSFIKGPATPSSGLISNANKITNDLRGTHPIGIKYTPAIATSDGALYDPDNTIITIGSGTVGAGNARSGTIKAMILYGAAKDTLECASCHDVHNTFANGGAGTGLVKLTNISATNGGPSATAGGQLCLNCHRK